MEPRRLEERNGTLNSPRQDSSLHRSRHSGLIGLGIDKSIYDQQASTFSGLNNDTRDESQKRFKIFLDEYRICLKDSFNCDEEMQNIILNMCKQNFQKLNENGRKNYVENLEDYRRKQLQADKYDTEEQIEIDKKLGYLLKNKDAKDAERRNIRMSVLNFLKDKINKKSNLVEKRSVLLNWSNNLDCYCNNHELVTSDVYNNIMRDAYLCYEHDKSKIQKNGKNANYKEENMNIYQTIKEINKSLYPEQEKKQLYRQENQQRAEREWQDLLVQEQEMHQQQLGIDHNHELQIERDNRHDRHRQRTTEQRREQHQRPKQRQIQISRQTLERWSIEIEQSYLRPTVISEIREYSERLLQQVRRANNPQERNESTLRQLRHQAHKLRHFLYPGLIYGVVGRPSERSPELREAMKIMKAIMREFEAYDLHRMGTSRTNIPTLDLKQHARELKQEMQRLLEQQGSRNALEQLRDRIHSLDESTQWWVRQTLLVDHMPYLDSAKKRVSKLKRSIDNILRQNDPTSSQSMQEIQESGQQRQPRRVPMFMRQLFRILACGYPRQQELRHNQQMQHNLEQRLDQQVQQDSRQIREQHRQRRPLQRFKQRLWHILACGSPRQQELRHDLHRQRTPER